MIDCDVLVNSVYKLLMDINKSVSHRKNISIEKKRTADFVTNIDLKVEKKLIEGLKNIDNIPCLSEESKLFMDYVDYWVIDPIDGTTNLIHDYPSFCVSIAKVRNNITEYGFVYNLATKELFIGIKSQGSYLINTKYANKKKICVSKINNLSDGLIGFGFPYDRSKIDSLFNMSNIILKSCHDLKRNGPASLDICYVASGRFDGYFEYDLNEWDYKAAKLILEEAGGKITNWRGDDVVKGTNNICASNVRLHKQILKLLIFNN
ncbi:MAG: inositol monophosphatase family protein [Clostridia bacterium]|nr:inositol monophosphatase family protein [Clostridia bacterium]